jgi:hypothetical protein
MRGGGDFCIHEGRDPEDASDEGRAMTRGVCGLDLASRPVCVAWTSPGPRI